MNGKPSLRQIAEELGVSHSYLSQVIHGKRPASEKIVSQLGKIGLLVLTGKQNTVKSGKQLLEHKQKIVEIEAKLVRPQRNSNPCYSLERAAS